MLGNMVLNPVWYAKVEQSQQSSKPVSFELWNYYGNAACLIRGEHGVSFGEM